MRSERGGQTVIHHVKKRNAATLWALVRKHTYENDVPTDLEIATRKEKHWYHLHTDGWAAYLLFDFKKIKRIHGRNMHGPKDAEKRSMAHSNLSEGLWGALMNELKRTYITHPGGEDWLDFVFEAQWKLNVRAIPVAAQPKAIEKDFEEIFEWD